MAHAFVARHVLAVLALASVAIASLCGCMKLPQPQPRPVSVLVVVLDLSVSTADAASTRCDELGARVRQALRAPRARRLDVLALGTGDGLTALEPIVLVPWQRWEPADRLYERPGFAEQAREAWLESVRATCRATSRETRSSPVYIAIRRGAESLRAHCSELERRRESCDRRMLAVHSDLRENEDPAIRQHLRRGDKGGSLRPLPHVDTEQLEVSLCGVSVTSGEEYVSPDTLSRVWQQVVGAQMPPLDAACPSEPHGAAESGGARP